MFGIPVLISALVLGYTVYITRRSDYTAVCKRIGTSIPSMAVYYPGLSSWSRGDDVLTYNSRIPGLRRRYPPLGNFQYPKVHLRSRTCRTRGYRINRARITSTFFIHQTHISISSRLWVRQEPRLLYGIHFG